MATPLPAPRPATARFEAPRRGGPNIKALLGVGITVDKAAGQTIVVEGDPRTHVFRVLTGAVRLYKALADGRRQVIDFLVAGDCFGLIGPEHHACSVEAIVPSTLARCPRSNLETALRANPELATRLLELAEAELERAHDQMLLLGRKSAQEKVAAFLSGFVRRRGGQCDGCVRIRLPMSRQDMADYLGLTIETVSRTLTRLRQDGLIVLATRHELVVPSLADLAALANGEPPGTSRDRVPSPEVEKQRSDPLRMKE